MPRSKLFVSGLMDRDLEETGKMIDWLACRQGEEDPTRSFRRPADFAAGTKGAPWEEEPTAKRPRFARSDSTCDELRLEAFAVLLENDASEIEAQENLENDAGEDHDCDDYTLVEVALFLQPAW